MVVGRAGVRAGAAVAALRTEDVMADPQRHLVRQVERPAGLGGHELGQLGLVHPRPDQVQGVPAGRQHALLRLPVGVGQDGPEDFVPVHDVRQGLVQRRFVHITGQAQGRRHGVVGPFVDQPVDEPEAALRIRQRHLRRAAGGNQRRPSRVDALVQFSGQAGHGTRVEQRAQREFDAEQRPQPAHQPGRQQGVAACREEVGVGADPLRAQHLCEQGGHHFLRRGVRPGVAARIVVGCGQGGPVHLPVRRHRQRVQQLDRRRDHKGRECAAQSGEQRLPQLLGRTCGGGGVGVPRQARSAARCRSAQTGVDEGASPWASRSAKTTSRSPSSPWLLHVTASR